KELPIRWMCDVARHPRVQRLLVARGPDADKTGSKNSESQGSFEERTHSKREPGEVRPELKRRGSEKEMRAADRAVPIARQGRACGVTRDRRFRGRAEVGGSGRSRDG